MESGLFFSVTRPPSMLQGEGDIPGVELAPLTHRSILTIKQGILYRLQQS